MFGVTSPTQITYFRYQMKSVWCDLTYPNTEQQKQQLNIQNTAEFKLENKNNILHWFHPQG